MPLDGSSIPQLARDLIAAKALIDTPERWCQGAGRSRDLLSGKLVGRCAAVAISDVAGIDRNRHDQGINDLCGHAAVMRAFDAAIEKALNPITVR